MPDLVAVTYGQTKRSKTVNALGMREMQTNGQNTLKKPWRICLGNTRKWSKKIRFLRSESEGGRKGKNASFLKRMGFFDFYFENFK